MTNGKTAEELGLELGALYTKQELAARDWQENLEKLLKENPDKGISKIKEFYKQGLRDAYTDDKGKHQSYAGCGGPYEAMPRAICNAVGSVYPQLTREQKNNALRQIIHNILDEENYLVVQSVYTSGIREPLLLADIALLRPLYWPGLNEGKAIVQKYNNFDELRADFIDENGLFIKEHAQSDFVLANSLLRSDFCNFGEDYALVANKDFLNRVLKGIIAFRFGMRYGGDVWWNIEKGTHRLKELLPESLHERIEPLRIEADWVNINTFYK